MYLPSDESRASSAGIICGAIPSQRVRNLSHDDRIALEHHHVSPIVCDKMKHGDAMSLIELDG